jgi:hypothetical protein
MKQTAAIFLLVVFSFNMFGYRVVYNYLASRADIKLELALDHKGYDDEDLISIRQAINLPYYSSSDDFKRLDGEINVDGTIYKYVKVRVYKDSLELLCIPHYSKMKIQNSKNEFYKLVNELNTSDHKKKSGSEQKQTKVVTSEFEELVATNFAQAHLQALSTSFFYTTPSTSDAVAKAEERPPDEA